MNTGVMKTISRPALRYFGSKWRLAPWIIGHFPLHGCYVEPFCGAASVFLRKQPAEFEVINDLDGDIVNFFRVLRERVDEFIYVVGATPYSREEFDLSWQPADDPLERARRYYVRSWQGWTGKGVSGAHWRIQHSNNRGKSVVDEWNQIEHLKAIAQRLKQAFVENDEAMDVIRRYDQLHTLFYLDPPYLPEVRSDRFKQAYQCEVDRAYHERLLDALLEVQGMVVISGYPSQFYNERLEDWKRYETTARTTNTSNTVTEVIWVSPRTAETQLPLFQFYQIQETKKGARDASL